jgi:hypothetical protein
MKTMLPLLTTFTVFATALHLGAQEPQRPSQGRSGQGGTKGPPGGREGGFGGEGFRPPVHPLETALDANGDGGLDAKEIANASPRLRLINVTAGDRDSIGPRRPPVDLADQEAPEEEVLAGLPAAEDRMVSHAVAPRVSRDRVAGRRTGPAMETAILSRVSSRTTRTRTAS